MTAPLIELRDIRKAFMVPSARRTTIRESVFGVFAPNRFERLQVLDGVNLEVSAGETLGIMGRNGSGKSTLLKILCGVYPADTGTLRCTAGITPILELGLGWNPELDAVDNIYLLGTVLGLSLSDVRDRLDAILAFAEVERFAHLQLKHYSSGMASRLAYAVAFHAVREVLVLDEVFAVGDAGFRAKCETRYNELHRAGHSVVLVSHEPRVVETFCSRAVLLDAGSIVAEGSGAEVARRYLECTGVAGPSPAGAVGADSR